GSVSNQLILSGYNTVKIALIATVVTLVCGLVVTWAARTVRHGAPVALSGLFARIATSGYAIPGTVLAIRLLMPIMLLGRQAAWGWQAPGNRDPGLLLMGTSTALVCAYLIRFLAISIGGIEAGLSRIPPSLEQASRLL